jgi:hypothetical protein
MTTQELNTKFDQFFKQFNGYGLDFDHAYGNQCFDLIQEWNVNWLGNPFIPGGYARQILDADRPGYTRVWNGPVNSPQKGDIVVWGGNYNGGPGHTGVATGKGDANTFECFVQNDPLGSVCHLKTYSYFAILGWLQPKTTNPVPLTYQQMVDQIRTLGSLPADQYKTKVMQIVKG